MTPGPMRMPLLFAALALVPAVAGAKPKQDAKAAGASKAPACGAKVLPLAVGNQWTYNSIQAPQQYQTDAVNDFITALAADPYNIKATYGLAAAYAKIGRKQCSINLLARLLEMRPHPSQHAEVEAKLDHLLGRNRQALDPDFNDMRRDDRFRALIQKMCEGTNDANCVYGAQRENRER